MKNISDLKNTLKNAEGKQRMSILLRLSRKALHENMEESQSYAEEALQLAKQLKDSDGEIRACEFLYQTADLVGNTDASIAYVDQGLALAQKTQNIQAEVTFLNTKAFFLLKKNANMEGAKDLLNISEQLCIEHDLEEERSSVALYKAYWLYVNGALNESYEKWEICLEEFVQQENRERQATCYRNMALLESLQNNYNQALELYEQAVKIEKAEGLNRFLQISYMGMGTVFFYQGDYPQALECYFKGLSIVERLGAVVSLPSFLINIGNIYGEEENYEKSLAFYHRALRLFTEFQNTNGCATTLINIGDTYLDQEDYEKALVNFEEALLFANKYNSKRDIAPALLGKASSYKGMNQIMKAMDYYMQSADLCQETGDRLLESEIFIAVAEMNFETDQPLRAKEYAERALELSTELGSENSIKKSLEILYKIHKALHDFDEALRYFELFTQKKEALFNMQKSKEMLQMENSYEFERKEQAIALLEKDKIIQAQKITELEQSQQITQMNLMIDAQEKERKRIASELHDGLGVLLSTVKFGFSGVEEYFTEEGSAKKRFHDAMILLDDCCREVRNVSHNLMPKAILDCDFKEVLHAYLSDINRMHSFRVNLHVEDVSELEEKLKVNIFRIIQESINNIIKYANASEVNVQLIQHDTDLVVIIEDNGNGFDLEEAHQKDGIGLKNLASRVNFMKGAYQIDTAPNMGTIITMEIPVTNPPKRFQKQAV